MFRSSSRHWENYVALGTLLALGRALHKPTPNLLIPFDCDKWVSAPGDGPPRPPLAAFRGPQGVKDRFAACPTYHFSAQVNIFKLSARLAVRPSAAEGSKPQCIMQCSQRGSFPGP
jgi:hypothetical protein